MFHFLFTINHLHTTAQKNFPKNIESLHRLLRNHICSLWLIWWFKSCVLWYIFNSKNIIEYLPYSRQWVRVVGPWYSTCGQSNQKYREECRISEPPLNLLSQDWIFMLINKIPRWLNVEEHSSEEHKYVKIVILALVEFTD